MQKCENKLMKKWCNNKGLNLAQLKTRATGANGPNLYNGDKLMMCEECRKAHNGGFKIVKE